MTFAALGDSAVVLNLGNLPDLPALDRVRAVGETISRRRPAGVIDVVGAFASVVVYYDLPQTEGFEELCHALEALVEAADTALVSLPPSRLVEIPVCYGGEFGPDLDAVAARARMSTPQVIALHESAEFRVTAIGFAPGFAYLEGLPEPLRTPRRSTPRFRVVPGSVGIGGSLTGVYPLATPGGWNLIGRTPRRMFDPGHSPPALLRAGDRVRFHAISADEFTRRALEAAAAAKDSVPLAGALVAELGKHFPITVERPGMWTTVQDLGRPGQRASGVPLSGAADTVALRVANLLVGNPEDAPALECTLVGPDLTFSADTLVALGGAEFEGLASWQPVRIQKGTTLRLGAARRGARGYLAVAGGFALAPVLGSRSTYARAALGGLDGRALRAGDRLWAHIWTPLEASGHWRIDRRILPAYTDSATVRVIAGAHAAEFGRALYASEYRVGAQSDRMGARLDGPALRRSGSGDVGSAAVLPGTIQVPPDGRPIVLLADAQTLGGYPQVAHVITVDLALAAQLRPGDRLRFREVTLAEAHAAWRAREHDLAMLREGLAQKFEPHLPPP